MTTDPFFEDTVLCLDGSAVDHSQYAHALKALGGAAFVDGVAADLMRIKRFEVDDPGGLFNFLGDFTMEARVRSYLPGGYYGTICAGNLWDHGNEPAWFGFCEMLPGARALLVRRANNPFISRVPSENFPKNDEWNEVAVEKFGDEMRLYIGGYPFDAVYDSHAWKMGFSNGGVLRIGCDPLYQPEPEPYHDVHPVSISRLRVTRTARFRGASYVVPESYFQEPEPPEPPEPPEEPGPQPPQEKPTANYRSLKLVQTAPCQFDLAPDDPADDDANAAAATLVYATLFTDQIAPARRAPDPWDRRGWYKNTQAGSALWHVRRQPLTDAARREAIALVEQALKRASPALTNISVSERVSNQAGNISRLTLEITGLHNGRTFLMRVPLSDA
jgi:phage gp46-like protein